MKKSHQQANEEVWIVEDNVARCVLEDDYVLFVSREPNGIKLEVKDFAGNKPKLMYCKFIGDLELGHIYRRKKV